MTADAVQELEVDVAVVGAGPAALAFAERVGGAGLTVALIDEQLRPGGQILRQPPGAFRVDGWLDSPVYRRPKAALARLAGLPSVRFIGGASVASAYPDERGFELWLAGAGVPRRVRARRLLAATGCYDLPPAFPGWTLPGVMTAGAVQAFLKSQQFTPDGRIVFCGTHPLQLIAAEQLVKAGARVEAVVFAQPAGAVLRLLAHAPAALANAGKLAQAASALAGLLRAGVAVRFGAAPVRALGEDRVTGVELERLGPGAARETLACEALALCFGFLPQSELPRSLEAAFAWAGPYGGWRILHDDWMRSSVPGLYVAGEVTGVGGADMSLVEGALAGLGVLLDEGHLTAARADDMASGLRREHRRCAAFAAMLRDLTSPEAALARMAREDCIVCRCENVTRRAIEDARRDNVGLDRPTSIKLLTRAGMGPCQGRNCEHAVVRLACGGREPRPMDAFTARFPVRASPLGRLV
ncbi:MAG: NAD(P)/FAD-dependent oxidoreductase [Caulobacteraceae bacterium]